MKISCTEHRSNQEVLDMVDENRSLMNNIRQRQKNWLGHVLRISQFLLCRVLEGRMEGTIQFNSIYFSSRLIAHGKNVQYRMIKNI